jgi:hypothetical protein
MKMLGALAFLGLVLIAGAANAQSRVESPPDPYVHRGTGFAMPAKVGDFVRGTVTEYNAEASDAGANYDLIVDGQSVATVTVYVYPPASLGNPAGADGCKASFDGAKQAIVERFPDARLQRDETLPAPDPDAQVTGAHAAYTLRGDFFSPGGEIMSDIYLYCPGDASWHVKYRVSAPADTPRNAEVKAFMNALEWPESLGG